MYRSNVSRTSCGRVLVIDAQFYATSGPEGYLGGVAVERPALSQLLIGEAALVGAGAALQVLDAQGSEELRGIQRIADAAGEDAEGVGAGNAGRTGAEGVRQ